MTKLNFKTKKVTLPLDINKTYVLVDVDGYKSTHGSNQSLIFQYQLKTPFKLSYVGDGYEYGDLSNSKDTVINIELDEHNFFREVIYPESGDVVIMTETNSTGRYIAYDDKQHMHVINVDGVLTYAEDDEFVLKQEERSWQEVLCEEFDIDYNKDEDSFKFLRGYSSDGAIKLAKRVIELSGE